MVIDLPDPDKTPVEERRKLRILNEDEKFDCDHYLADFFDDTEMIETCILKYKPEDDESDDYTEKEFDCLKSLPKRTYLLDKLEKFYAYAGMIDILYAYCYNDRINCGESNVESGWTISKMSSTLSWFDVRFVHLKSINKITAIYFYNNILIKIDFQITGRLSCCLLQTKFIFATVQKLENKQNGL